MKFHETSLVDLDQRLQRYLLTGVANTRAHAHH